MTTKILPIRQCFNCGHCFDSKKGEDSELCPLCLKEVDSAFDDDGEIDFHDMHEEVEETIAEMLDM